MVAVVGECSLPGGRDSRGSFQNFGLGVNYNGVRSSCKTSFIMCVLLNIPAEGGLTLFVKVPAQSGKFSRPEHMPH